MAGINVASLTAEFIGTFILIFTVGCNVLSSNPVWGGVSIACSLMVGIYALGGVSGANFNPAVSAALGMSGKMPWAQVGAYCGVQVVSGIVASLCYTTLFGANFNLGPTKGFGWWQAMLCEMLYTFMLCFVVLNTAASKKLGGNNQFYGLAIGFVIVAGAYGPGAVSGGCFNPAVAIAIDTSSITKGFGWCLVYSSFEIFGAVLAVGLFKAMRPEENDESEAAPAEYGLKSKMVSECVGTFMLVLTAGLNVLVHSKAAAFSIAASLMCMIYACGDVSGGHFNPAVTVSIMLSGRNKIETPVAMYYMAAQIGAGLLGALTYALIMGGVTFPIGPGKGFGWMGVATAEIAFTFVLTYVVLCVATVRNAPAPEFTGWIIGSCVTVGGLAIGIISGGSLNPAVSFGIGVARIFFGGNLWRCFVYMLLEFIGGAAAAAVFKVTHADEYEDEGEKKPLQAEA
jgi:aquaporin Z